MSQVSKSPNSLAMSAAVAMRVGRSRAHWGEAGIILRGAEMAKNKVALLVVFGVAFMLGYVAGSPHIPGAQT